MSANDGRPTPTTPLAPTTPTTTPGDPAPAGSTPDLDRTIARLLTVGIYLSVILLAIGTVAFLAAGRSPLDAAATFDISRIPRDLPSLEPTVFLWLGLVAVIATPSARVVASLVAYARAGERGMVVVSALILLVIASSVLLARITEG